MNNSVQRVVIPILLGMFVMLGVKNSVAADASWHAESKSYRVYMGVVPVALIKKNPYLVDRDKTLHGGVDKKNISAQHIMISIFSKQDNSRILDATAIAEVKVNKLLSSDEVEKPLEKMVTSGTVTYGNYFDMPGTGEYKVEVSIYESNKNGSEKVVFVYKAM